MLKFFKQLLNDFINMRSEYKENEKNHRERMTLARKEFDEQHQRVLKTMRKPL